MANHIVLFEPLMPANTGNIARTCAGTNTELHLIEPLGFSTDDKYLKRAGLDYWDKVKITYHANLPAFLETLGADAKLHVDRPINGYDVLEVLRLVFVGIICGMFARLRGNV